MDSDNISLISEMEYREERDTIKILSQGKYRGREFKILSYGTHPCIYLKIDETEKYYGCDYEDINLRVHGGLTFSNFIGVTNPDNRFGEGYWIGWDYAHAGDAYGTMIGGHKYTTLMLLEEMKKAVIDLEQIS